MAIWQYNLFFISQEKLQKYFSVIPQSLESYCISELLIIPGDVDFSTLLHILPEQTSRYHKKIWGYLDKNCIISIQCHEGVEIQFRIDVSNINLSMIDLVIDIAKRNKCLFMDDCMLLIEPDIRNILLGISKSQAKQFVNSPRDFLSNVSKIDIS